MQCCGCHDPVLELSVYSVGRQVSVLIAGLVQEHGAGELRLGPPAALQRRHGRASRRGDGARQVDHRRRRRPEQRPGQFNPHLPPPAL